MHISVKLLLLSSYGGLLLSGVHVATGVLLFWEHIYTTYCYDLTSELIKNNYYEKINICEKSDFLTQDVLL